MLAVAGELKKNVAMPSSTHETLQMTNSSETRVAQALDELGIAYETLECDPQFADTALFCEHYDIPLNNSANTILVTSKSAEKKYAACVLLADSRLDVNKTVRKRLGARRISFASPEATQTVTGMSLGGVTPVALPPELPLWVDARVMHASYIILGGGSRAKKIKISPVLFTLTANTEIIEGLANPV